MPTRSAGELAVQLAERVGLFNGLDSLSRCLQAQRLDHLNDCPDNRPVWSLRVCPSRMLDERLVDLDYVNRKAG
jgi:hypothetical protein